MGDVSLLTTVRELLIITRTLVWIYDAAGNQINISINIRARCTLMYSMMKLNDRFSYLYTSDDLVILSLLDIRRNSAWTSSSLLNPPPSILYTSMWHYESLKYFYMYLHTASLEWVTVYLACCKFCENEVNLLSSLFAWVNFCDLKTKNL